MSVIPISNLTIQAKKRLTKEFDSINDEKDMGLSAELVKNESGVDLLNEWNVFIDGQPDTLFVGYRLHAKMTFPDTYPYIPPTFEFISNVFHPNVYSNGKVCISILQSEEMNDQTFQEISNCTWTPGLTVRTVCVSIISLLNDPNIFSPANIDASNLYRDNREEYERMTREYLKKSCKRI